jgi:4-amino-4-deoxy-L-arabinose transferase-like glycosyltransferase
MLTVGGAAASSPTLLERARPALSAFLLLLALFVGLHMALRLATSPVLAIDDAREALLSQTFELGYLPRQPPLYNWMVWASVRLFGVSVATLTLCRYATLSVAYLFLYLSAAHVLEHRTLAMLAAFSLILMGPFSWDAHAELTHSLAALASASATFYALLRLERSGSALTYLGFGVALAAGFLSKFSFGFFGGALLVAALATPEYRRRVLSTRFLLTIGTVRAGDRPSYRRHRRPTHGETSTRARRGAGPGRGSSSGCSALMCWCAIAAGAGGGSSAR